MTTFSIKVLGSGSAVPSPERNASGQVLSIGKNLLLVDCSEGTFLNLRKAAVSPVNIDYVFISHLHGDHYLGLPGLIHGMHLMGRKKKLHIAGPSGLYELIQAHLRASETQLRYRLHFFQLGFENSQIIVQHEDFRVESFLLKHRLPVWGFVFREMKRKKSNMTDSDGADLMEQQMSDIHKETKRKAQIQYANAGGRSYAYCTDTVYFPESSAHFQGVDLLYHEATFLKMHEKEAKATFHSTAEDAARMALLSEAKGLMIGHYSVRYADASILVDEARQLFEPTFGATDGLIINL